MKTSKHEHKFSYFNLFLHVENIHRTARKEKGMSPTISEIATRTGASEEHILECIESYQTDYYQSYLH